MRAYVRRERVCMLRECLQASERAGVLVCENARACISVCVSECAYKCLEIYIYIYICVCVCVFVCVCVL